ncbi:hypothetical protein [Sphingobium lignivorans]|uniref:Uncharacterized protein n=1 Tax=Sphingobium lignivorans TaxID=2735886 RepID=A0ABR6NJD9_9SPHN|nr:hypothetical protein [Sphingobium lignivorans]MBB5987394.1 hypothetical protein [Sphingobium lignivorans]
MNRKRRAEIDGLIASLREIERELGRQQDILADISSDEEAYRDAIPEGLWESERYLRAEASAEALCTAHDELVTLFDFDSVIASLEEAKQ